MCNDNCICRAALDCGPRCSEIILGCNVCSGTSADKWGNVALCREGGRTCQSFSGSHPCAGFCTDIFSYGAGGGGARHSVENPGVTLQGVQREGAGR